MELLKSKKFKLPKIYFISDRDEIKDLPVGIPFIYGDEVNKDNIIRLLEYEILYESAIRSGYPFNFKKLLKDNGYKTKRFGYDNPAFMEYKSYDGIVDSKRIKITDKPSNSGESTFSEYIKDSAAYVDINVLKGLKVFPLWMDDIEEAISVNINSFATINQNMYNKKLEGMYGGIDMASPPKNLIIIDISGSIPKAVSSTCLAMAKNMSEAFYADIMITGSKSTLYEYENLYKLDIESIYKENGMGNDQTYFKNLVTGSEKEYNTAIVFGDNHSPGYRWRNKFNIDGETISEKDGKSINKWKIKKLISLHTSNHKNNSVKHIAGYATWFSPESVKHIDNWVKYL